MARLKVKQISDFTSEVQALIDNDTDQNAALIDALEASVDSIETQISGNDGDIADLVSSVNSIEVDATTLAAIVQNNGGSVDNLEDSVDSLEGNVSDLEGADALLQASVNSLEAVAGGSVTSDLQASVNSLETAVSGNATDISDLDSNTQTALGDLQGSVNSIETVVGGLNNSVDTLEDEMDDIETSVNSLEVVVTQLQGDSSYRKQYGTRTSNTEFSISNAVEYASDDDISVFVNGHQIGHYAGSGSGWSTSNGTAFTFTDIGYDLEDDDVLYVIGHQ